MWYLTKYCLTQGIKTFEDQYVKRGMSDKMIGVKLPSYYCTQYYKLGKEIFATKTEALIDAEKRRLRKVVNLQKQLDKLEAMSFDT